MPALFARGALAVARARHAEAVRADVAEALRIGLTELAEGEDHARSCGASIGRTLIVTRTRRARAILAEIALALQVRHAGFAVTQCALCARQHAVAAVTGAALEAAGPTADELGSRRAAQHDAAADVFVHIHKDVLADAVGAAERVTVGRAELREFQALRRQVPAHPRG